MASKIPHNRLTRCRAALLAPAASAVFVGLVLAAHAALAFHTAERMSVTHDEYWHLPVGLLSWKSGRFDYDDINPPLLRMWAALPLVMMDVDDVTVRPAAIDRTPPRKWLLGPDAYTAARRFLYKDNDADRLLFASRFMTVLLGSRFNVSPNSYGFGAAMASTPVARCRVSCRPALLRPTDPSRSRSAR